MKNKSSSAYAIRKAEPADAAGIAAVARRAWRQAYQDILTADAQQYALEREYASRPLRQAIESDGGWFFVATRGKTVAGFAHFTRNGPGQARLVQLYVDPDRQRLGLGRRLLQTAARQLQAEDIVQCSTSVAGQNGPARAFYQQMGFRPQREYVTFVDNQMLSMVEMAVPVSQLLPWGPQT